MEDLVSIGGTLGRGWIFVCMCKCVESNIFPHFTRHIDHLVTKHTCWERERDAISYISLKPNSNVFWIVRVLSNEVDLSSQWACSEFTVSMASSLPAFREADPNRLNYCTDFKKSTAVTQSNPEQALSPSRKQKHSPDEYRKMVARVFSSTHVTRTVWETYSHSGHLG